MDEVAATAPHPSIPGFPGVFILIEDRDNTTPRSRLERLTTLPLGEKPPLVVRLKAPETHIHMLWGTKFVTPYFAQPTPEDGKVLAFARDICLGLLPEWVVVQPEWLTPEDVAVPQVA